MNDTNNLNLESEVCNMRKKNEIQNAIYERLKSGEAIILRSVETIKIPEPNRTNELVGICKHDDRYGAINYGVYYANKFKEFQTLKVKKKENNMKKTITNRGERVTAGCYEEFSGMKKSIGYNMKEYALTKGNPNWCGNPSYNLFFLTMQEKYFNELLQMRQYLYLTEVLVDDLDTIIDKIFKGKICAATVSAKLLSVPEYEKAFKLDVTEPLSYEETSWLKAGHIARNKHRLY